MAPKLDKLMNKYNKSKIILKMYFAIQLLALIGYYSLISSFTRLSI